MDFIQSNNINILRLSHWLNLSERMSPCSTSLNLYDYNRRTMPNSKETGLEKYRFHFFFFLVQLQPLETS